MKYLLIAVIVAGAFLSVPVHADSGVSITLTTTVVGNGGGGSFDSGGSYPNSMPNWATVFPSSPQSSSYIDSRPVQNNPPVVIPPVSPQSNTYVPPPVAPVPEERDTSRDNMMYLFIGLGAILIGLIIYLILPEQRVR